MLHNRDSREVDNTIIGNVAVKKMRSTCFGSIDINEQGIRVVSNTCYCTFYIVMMITMLIKVTSFIGVIRVIMLIISKVG